MEKTKIALGCDHIGFSLKEQIKKYLIQEKNAEIVIDPIQTEEEGNGTFIETTRLICEGIQQDTCRLALMICGTGLGFCSVANTYWGIRAAHASEPYTARRARKSLNAQILCLGCRVMSLEYCKMVVDMEQTCRMLQVLLFLIRLNAHGRIRLFHGLVWTWLCFRNVMNRMK